MPSRPTCRYSVLNPPRMIDGLLCGLLVEFMDPATNQEYPGQIVTTATVRSVTDLGGGYWQIVFERAVQFSSYTKVAGPGDAQEIVTEHNCGGNVCATPEYMRVLSFANDRAFGGDDRADRVVRGDVAETPSGCWGLVTEEHPFGFSPGTVNWNPGTPTPIVARIVNDLYSYVLRPMATRGFTVSSLTFADGYATLTTAAPHGLHVGDAISVSGAGEPEYNGEQIITSVPSATTFRFAVAGEPDSPATGTIVLSAGSNPEGRTAVFDPDATGLLADWCEVEALDSGTLATAPMARRIFNDTEGDPDPEYYPPAAQFGTGTTAEYWVHPRELSFRFSTATTLSGDQVRAYFWERSQVQTIPLYYATETVPQVLSIEEPFDGYGTADSLALMACATYGDFSHEYEVEDGEGSVEWRAGIGRQSVAAALLFDATGIVGAVHRTSGGAGSSSPSFVGGSYAYPFRVKVDKAGDVLTLSHRQDDGDAWTEAFSTTLGGIEEDTDGFSSVGAWDSAGVRFRRIVGDPYEVWDAVPFFLDASSGTGLASIYIGRAMTQGVTFARKYTKASGNAITAVRNLTADADMTAMGSGTAARRNGYFPDGDGLWLYAESNGDTVRVTFAADGSLPPAPGRPPRVFSQLNFATEDPEDPGVSTTDPGENRGNWCDGVTAYFEHAPDIAPGEAITFRRSPGWDPRDNPVLAWDKRKGAANGHDWETIPTDQYRARWLRRIVAIGQEYLENTIGTGLPCFRVRAKRMRTGAGATASTFNAMTRAIRAYGELWREAGVGQSAVTTREGIMQMSTGPTDFVCTDDGFKPTNYVWGTVENNFMDIPDLPYWGVVSETVCRIDSIARTESLPSPEPIETCGSDTRGAYEDWIAGEAITVVAPTGGLDLLGIPGTNVVGSGPGGGLTGLSFIAGFRVTGVSFNPDRFLRWLPDGAIIEKAWMRVRLNGFERHTWAWNLEARNYLGSGEPETYLFERYTNGGLEYSDEKAEPGGDVVSITNTALPPATSGSIGFALVGKRLNTSNVVLHDGQVVAMPAHVYRSLPGGVALTSVSSGEFAIVDVTGAVQALVDDRGSDLREYEFWPTLGLAPGAGAGEMAAFLESTAPETSATFVDGDGLAYGWNASMSGGWITFESINVGNILVQVRMPDGILADAVIHTSQPKFMP